MSTPTPQTQTLRPTLDDHRVARLAALAILIHVVESAFPSPLPGIKLGLANVITLAALALFGWRIAAWISLVRVLIGSLLTGTLLSPTFFLSLAGTTASLLVLCVATLATNRGLSLVGLAVLASFAHINGQFWLCYALLIPHPALLNLYPILVTAAFFLGILTGLIAVRLLEHYTEHPEY